MFFTLFDYEKADVSFRGGVKVGTSYTTLRKSVACISVQTMLYKFIQICHFVKYF